MRIISSKVMDEYAKAYEALAKWRLTYRRLLIFKHN
jgi:hypothetical protein